MDAEKFCTKNNLYEKIGNAVSYMVYFTAKSLNIYDMSGRALSVAQSWFECSSRKRIVVEIMRAYVARTEAHGSFTLREMQVHCSHGDMISQKNEEYYILHILRPTPLDYQMDLVRWPCLLNSLLHGLLLICLLYLTALV
jgi:hypothetical protein